jgi:transcription antitermination factor NusG
MSYWSVVQTESRREQVAADFLNRDAFEIYYPKILIPNNANTRERVAPLFPGYLFVEIVDHWWSVRWTTGVMRLLMMNDQPAKVRPELLTAIHACEVDGVVRLPEQNPKSRSRALACGDEVRVVRGSFEGRLGIYQGQSGLQRSRILLTLLGREVKTVVPSIDLVRTES